MGDAGRCWEVLRGAEGCWGMLWGYCGNAGGCCGDAEEGRRSWEMMLEDDAGKCWEMLHFFFP